VRARPNTRILSVALAVTGLLALPTAALAYAPSAGAFVTCAPAAVAIGDQITCVAGVFVEDTTVIITIDSGDLLTPLRASAVTTAVADANGQVGFTFRATESGSVGISLSGTRVDGTADGATFSSFTNVVVSDISPDVLGVSLDTTDGASLGAPGEDATDGASLGAPGDEVAEIANTGADAGVLAVIAVGAIAIGGGALVSSRRRRTSATA
jgi:LPXTG-motif cell wall-anchored protein